MNGITIEKGTQIQADVFSLHHNKELWGEDVEKFIPERYHSAKECLGFPGNDPKFSQ